MKADNNRRIGIDLGDTKIEGIVLEEDQSVSQRLRIPTPADSYHDIVIRTCDLIAELQQSLPSPATVGLGTPGSPSPRTGLMRNCNSVVLNDKPLQADLERRLGYAVRLENDANCFALSEALLGAGKDYRTVFGVIIGTGTGGGIVVDGQLLSGANGISGEWGHNTIPLAIAGLVNGDRPCYCGRRNCIETVLNGAGLIATYNEVNPFSSSLQIDARTIASLAQKGDGNATMALRRYSEILAGCLATIINTLDPDAIVLGGGLSNITLLYPMLAEYLPQHVFSDSLSTRILPPAYGDASGARGAACLWPIDQD